MVNAASGRCIHPRTANPPKRQERFTTGDAIFGDAADSNGDDRVIGLEELLMGVMQGDA